jgi:Tyrosine phosphatase family
VNAGLRSQAAAQQIVGADPKSQHGSCLRNSRAGFRGRSTRLLGARASVEHAFWLFEHELAGRPGPNQAPWNPLQLYAGGIRSILTLNLAIDVDSVALASAGITHEHIQFPKGEPPDEAAFRLGLEVVPRAYAWFETRVATGAVLVHCSHGKDRTALFMAYALMRRYDLGEVEAMAKVRQLRPNAFSAVGWSEFARDLLRVLSAGA